ncbi:MAG: outer membrane protein assembly factor, partial [Sphingomicrobium sp.]
MSSTAARLLCAAAIGLAGETAGLAQQVVPAAPPQSAEPMPDPAELDPSAPLDPLPDLGVDWPDVTTPDPTPAPAENGEERSAKIDDAIGERHYSLTVEGLEGAGDSAGMLAAFRKQSVLEAGRKKAANVAQISRRSQADSDLLAELLRSQGYYDAMVEPRIEGTGDLLRVTLAAEAGEQYRFASVELPGLDAAGPEEATKLRAAFAVKAGDPVIAAKVIAGGIELTRK